MLPFCSYWRNSQFYVLTEAAYGIKEETALGRFPLTLTNLLPILPQ